MVTGFRCRVTARCLPNVRLMLAKRRRLRPKLTQHYISVSCSLSWHHTKLFSQNDTLQARNGRENKALIPGRRNQRVIHVNVIL